MRILFATSFSGARTSIFISEYYAALARVASRLGHDVCIHDTHEIASNPGLSTWVRKAYRPMAGVVERLRLMALLEGGLRRGVLESVESFKPDVLFLYVINAQSVTKVVKEIRRRGVKVVMWVGLNPKVLSPGAQRVLPVVDCVFFYDPIYRPLFKELGCLRAEIVPMGVDLERFDAVQVSAASKENASAVAFVGMIDDTRRRLLGGLVGVDLGIWSWNVSAGDHMLSPFFRGEASGDRAIEVLKSSKISINIHREFEFSGGNYRLFEIPACGALQLVDKRPMIQNYFVPEQEIIFFDGPHDLREKIEYFLSHEDLRLEIVAKAKARVARDHGIVERFKQMESLLNEL